MSALQTNNKPSSQLKMVPGLAWLLALTVAFCTISHGGEAHARVFSQEAVRFSPCGTEFPLTIVDPDSLEYLNILPCDLGSGRTLEIRTNLPSSRHEEIFSLAEVVRRCYSYLEQETGRVVSGDILLYLLQYPQRPSCYRFEVEVADSEPWNQVRLALMNTGQPILGPGASPHITEFIYDTLPHELTHGLLNSTPTVRHDLDGQESLGTRWFIEGLCEVMAKGFSQLESPDFHRASLQRRNLNRILEDGDLGSMVWQWGQSSEFSWDDESDLYGLSMLLFTSWTNHVELIDLLALMSQRGGDFNGEGLLELLVETAGVEPWELLMEAKGIARQVSRPVSLSFLEQ